MEKVAALWEANNFIVISNVAKANRTLCGDLPGFPMSPKVNVFPIGIAVLVLQNPILMLIKRLIIDVLLMLIQESLNV
jgi:hypothetical protein